jgi:hypothetical protein
MNFKYFNNNTLIINFITIMYAMENKNSSYNLFKNYNPSVTQMRANSAVPGYSFYLSKQSPKVEAGKLRKNVSKKDKLFSLLDIPLSKVARSFKMPIQYERPNIDMNKTTELETNENLLTPRDQLRERCESLGPIQGNKPECMSIKTAFNNIRTCHNEKVMVVYPPHNSNIRISKTSQSQRNFADNLPGQNVNEIKKKMQHSDIFFFKNSIAREDNYDAFRQTYNNKSQTKYTDSDIFLRKDDLFSRAKSGEKYMFKKIDKLYDTTSKSNSEWIDKNLYNTLLGHSSRQYHILNPGVKHITKTRQEVINEADGLYNPICRQKSLCEFIDLNRVGVPNPNKEFLKAFKTSKNVFGRTSNVCAAYLDIHREYRDLSDRPFIKKPF